MDSLLQNKDNQEWIASLQHITIPSTMQIDGEEQSLEEYYASNFSPVYDEATISHPDVEEYSLSSTSRLVLATRSSPH